ncbi:hypothetical protein BDQ12DRAFT_216270 [Crucibulum laeve]|uniref:Uncharacterized protein n=1 Tax=Crucibulum laeve TaxID=68775 RepID=A0A5C3M822_9AGAR|nr:hypothetical protein BDQ12DRAFT_216270 [Crucibulum laeve]
MLFQCPLDLLGFLPSIMTQRSVSSCTRGGCLYIRFSVVLVGLSWILSLISGGYAAALCEVDIVTIVKRSCSNTVNRNGWGLEAPQTDDLKWSIVMMT